MVVTSPSIEHLLSRGENTNDPGGPRNLFRLRRIEALVVKLAAESRGDQAQPRIQSSNLRPLAAFDRRVEHWPDRPFYSGRDTHLSYAVQPIEALREASPNTVVQMAALRRGSEQYECMDSYLIAQMMSPVSAARGRPLDPPTTPPTRADHQ